jgi:hypothetical protein
MDQLERAARDGRKVAITRRGTEFVVFARRLDTFGKTERFIGILPMTGDEIAFELGHVEDFRVI